MAALLRLQKSATNDAYLSFTSYFGINTFFDFKIHFAASILPTDDWASDVHRLVWALAHLDQCLHLLL